LAFAILLILCALFIIPFRYSTWILLILLLFFAWRLLKSKKFMPAGLMVLLTVLALALPPIISRIHSSLHALAVSTPLPILQIHEQIVAALDHRPDRLSNRTVL